MKNVVLTILRTGYTKSKKDPNEIMSWLWPLKGLFCVDPLTGWVRCNDNPFWRSENNLNRDQLISDIRRMSRRNMLDRGYFSICNRIANGDAYGIVR